MENDYFQWVVPKELQIPKDPLQLRLDFYANAVVLTEIGKNSQTCRIVSAADVAHALARELSYGSPVLGPHVLRWVNTPGGEMFVLWEEPQIRKVALQTVALGEPRRFTIPLPGLIFVCRNGGHPPSVFAAKRRPTKESDVIYKAPVPNVFNDGRVCPGTHTFPLDVKNVPDSFWRSFFSPTADLHDRSKRFPGNIVKLWEYLDGKAKFPMNDLVEHGTLGDLNISRR